MGIFDKRKEKKADERAKVVAYIEKFPTKLATQDKKYRKDPDIALIALKGSVDAWEGVDKSLKKNKDFIALAVKQDAAVIKKLYPEPIDNLLIAKYFYRLNKDAVSYFSKKIQHQIDVEENARKVRQEADAQASAKASVKFSSVLPVVETEEDIKKREAEEEAKKALKTLTPEEEALLILVRTLFVDDKIKALDPEADAEEIETIKNDASAKIGEAVKAVGTINITDEEGKSLLKNFFEYNRSVIVWRELEKWCKKEKLDIEDELLTWLSDIEGKDSSIYKEVQKYVDEREKEKKFEKKYNSYCKKLEKGKIKINEVPPKFVDKAMCMLYIETVGATGYWDLLGLGDFQADEDICRLVVAKDPSAIDTINEDIAEKIKAESEADEEK